MTIISNFCLILMLTLTMIGCMTPSRIKTPPPSAIDKFDKMWDKQLPNDRKYEDLQRQGIPPAKRPIWDNRPKNFPKIERL